MGIIIGLRVLSSLFYLLAYPSDVIHFQLSDSKEKCSNNFKEKKVTAKRTWVERYSLFLASSPNSSLVDGSVTREPRYSRVLFPILEGTWRSSTMDRDLVLSTLGLSYNSFVWSTSLPTRLTRRRILLENDWLCGKTERNLSNDKS